MSQGDDRAYLDLAIEQAKIGWDEGGIPIGAALVHDGNVLAVGRNRRVQKNSAILHGETDAIENAGRQPAKVYRASTIYTTLSPCLMCAGTILMYEIPRVVVGENRTFEQSEELLRSYGVKIDVVDDAECLRMMNEMIAQKPQLWSEDIGVDESELKQ